MIGKLYTLGYAAPDSRERLLTLMADERMQLFDIRYNPVSRRFPQWSKDISMKSDGSAWIIGLNHLFSPRYQHIQELGNTAYKDKKEIKLANPDVGIPYVVSYLERGYDIILLCACKHYEICHRRMVAELVRQALPEVEVLP